MIEIVKSEPSLTVSEIRDLCIKNRWFTNGDNEQYNKLFDLVEWDRPLSELALVIWLCSDRKSKFEIEATLKAAAERKAKILETKED